MRRVFSIIGAVAVGLFVLAAAGIGYVAWRGAHLNDEAASFSGDAVRSITAHWDSAQLMSRATPELAGALGPDQLARMFAWFGTLGPLQNNPACTGTSFVNATAAKTTTTGRYNCTARYQKGAATISLALVKTGGVWRIAGFNVLSPVLIPNAPTQKI